MAELKKNKTMLTLLTVCLIIFQIATLAALLFGATYCYGVNTSAINVINFIFELFTINSSNVTIVLSRTAIGVAYVVILVIGFKQVFGTIAAIQVWKNKKITDEWYVDSLLNDCSVSFCCFIDFIIISAMISEFNISVFVQGLLVVGTILSLGLLIYKRYIKKGQLKLEAFLINGVKILTVGAVLIAISFFIISPVVKKQCYDFVFIGVAIESAAIYSIYTKFIDNILVFTLIILYMHMIRIFISDDKDNQVKASAKLIIFSSLIMVLNCIFRTYATGGNVTYSFDTEVLAQWYEYAKVKYLPICLLSIACTLAISCEIPKDFSLFGKNHKKKESKDKQNLEETDETKENVEVVPE